MSDLVARVASLEAHVDTIRQDVGVLKQDTRDGRERLIKLGGQLERLEDRVERLPTKGSVIAYAFSIVAAIGALILFEQRIQQWIGLVPPPGS